MKRKIAFFMLLALLLCALAGCGTTEQKPQDPGFAPNDPYNDHDRDPNGGNHYEDGPLILTELPEGMSGSEAARLILANQRLNAKLLQNSENIFEDGAKTLRQFASMATASLAENTFASGTDTASVGTRYPTIDGSYVEIDGTRYTWGGFTEYSNSYEYFLNLTGSVTNSAEMGARLIDDVKKHVRVVDKWVNVNGEEFYLHVEKNSEMLISRNADFVRLCIRSRNAEGSNLYEVAQFSNGGSSRMLYSPGRLCEYSHVLGNFNHNFLAENNKGFWEVVDVGVHDTHNNVSCMVIKDDICYDAFYNADLLNRGVSEIKVISADRKTDILDFGFGDGMAFITLKMQAFRGYWGVALDATPDQLSKLEDMNTDSVIQYYADADGNTVYISAHQGKPQVLLDNGGTIREGDVFLNDKVVIQSVQLMHFSREPDETRNGRYGGGYTPEMRILVKGEDYKEQMENLDAFLKEVGLICTRDMDYVRAGILQAFSELEQFTKYHQWNENPIYTNEDIAKGWENNLKKHEAYKAMYEALKDVEVLDFSDRQTIELHINFAPITAQSATAITNHGFDVTAAGHSLTVEDTMLFVVGEKYTVRYALVLAGETDTPDLHHIEVEESVGVEFTGGDRFTVTGDAAFTLPLPTEGKYALVAYIATADGIRSSAYQAVSFTTLTEAEERRENRLATLAQTENGVTLTVTKLQEIEIVLSGTNYTQLTMTEALSEEIYQYAFVADGASLEILQADGSWKAWEPTPVVPEPQPTEPTVTPEKTTPESEPVEAPKEEALSSGTYRLKYQIVNGEQVEEGYVYTVYNAELTK